MTIARAYLACMEESGRIVVIDANFGRRGHFKLEEIRRWAQRLSDRGHAVVIPEPVVWEWAQHAHEELIEVRASIENASKTIDASLGVTLPALTLPDVGVLADRIREGIEATPGIDVIEAEPDDAVDAIAQQVMQTGVGSREGSTKTGAADALILCTVERLLDRYDQVVLATADKRLGSAADELNVVVVRTHRDLWGWYGLTQPPTNALIDAIRTLVLDRTQEAIALNERSPLLSQGEYVGEDVLEAARFETFDVRQTDVSIEALEDVSVEAVEVVEGDEVPRLAVVNVRACAIVFLVNWFIGGFDGKLIDESGSERVEISVPITVEFEEDWTPIGFDADDRADVRTLPDAADA